MTKWLFSLYQRARTRAQVPPGSLRGVESLATITGDSNLHTSGGRAGPEEEGTHPSRLDYDAVILTSPPGFSTFSS